MNLFTKELNSRQWKLYNYLKENSGTYKKHIDIMIETGLYGENYDTVNSKGGRTLRKDLLALRNSGIIQTTIISHTRKGVKLATLEEYQHYSKNKLRSLIRQFNTLRNQDKKAGLNNQYRLVFNTEKELFEAFVE